ncbi:MAG: hypothetical protein WC613_00315 [Candidatus Aenigmatarchaeota archaeon]
MSNFIGIDSRKFLRKGITNDFLGMIAIGIEVKSYDYFKDKYISVISDLLRKRGIKPDRSVYKSYDLHRLGITHDFYKEFYNSILDHIESLYVFYSYFTYTPLTSRVRIFPFTSNKEISFIDFIGNHLDSPFPHVCLWQLHTMGHLKGNAFLDGFNGKVTNAWKAIEDLTSFFILPNGDKSNALIASSDILMNYFDIQLFDNGGKLTPTDIKDVFPELDKANKLKTMFISNACLYHIIPLSEALNIPTHQKIPHPIFFIFKEKNSGINERTIEHSPLFRKIIDLSFKNNGCFKFFDADFDYNVISEKDYFIHFGDEGKKTSENLKNLGYSLKPLNFAELEKL